MRNKATINLSCPLPIDKYPKVLLAHGGGGRLMHNLIREMFIKGFGKSVSMNFHDSAVFKSKLGRYAFTTDSYVVSPLFFPGGDIGKLAVYGTVNDLAMSGAEPMYISCGFILEEGLDMGILWKIILSIKEACEKCGVKIITGDTKVVEKTKGDGIFINTTGIGRITHKLNIGFQNVRVGDFILLNGDIGRHGIAIMQLREGLEFESKIESDCAPLNKIIKKTIKSGIEIHCLRDLTRGGLGSVVNEIAESSLIEIELYEDKIPVRKDVQAACEILGFDPIYVANEGRFISFIPKAHVERALKLIPDSAIIGIVKNKHKYGMVKMKNVLGTSRIVEMLNGEQLPRIC